MSDIPSHIGFIVDGNRRWAKERGLDGYDGHEAGFEVLKTVLIGTLNRGVSYVSAYVFSTENWRRPKMEIRYLMRMFVKCLEDNEQLFHREGVRVRIVGTRQGLSKKVVQAIDHIEESTRQLAKGQLLLCFNYGGHNEVVDAVKRIIESGVEPSQVTDELVAENLYAPDVPPCDLVVRTGGEKRLSNFMMWRSTYSELMFVDKYWPDMTNDDVTIILDEYNARRRRFGK